MAKKICLPKKDLVKEHSKVVKVLKKAGAKSEAKKQAKELKEYKKK